MVILDTYFDVDWNKCIKCYECINYCTDKHKDQGTLGFIVPSMDVGYPEYVHDNPGCHHCEIEIDGQTKGYACNHLCKQDAMQITRW